MVAVLLSWAGAASAHTVFEGSQPPDGSTLANGPRTMSLDFSSDVDLSLARVQLTDGARHRLAVGGLSVDPIRPTRLVVPLPVLPPETYRLSFSVRDSVDLHVTDSSVVFGVGRVASLKAVRPPSRGPDLAEVALRWLARSGLALVLGALAVSLAVIPQAISRIEAARQLQRRLLGLAMIGVGMAAAGDTAVLALQASQIGPLQSTFSRLLTESDFGRRWIIGMQLSVGLLLALWWLRHQATLGTSLEVRAETARWQPPARGRVTRVVVVSAVACLLAAAEAIAVGLSGHTGASSTPTAVGVTLRGAHLLAVGVWIGGLAALVVALAAVAHHPDPAASRAQLLRRFSPMAAVGLVAVTITGLLLSGDQVATVTALLTTWYGLTLVTKVGLAGLVALLGLRHARLVRSSRAADEVDRRTRHTLRLELVGGLALIVFGAGLAATAPARGPQFGPKPLQAPSAITTASGDLIIRVSLQPNRPGRNLVAVDVLNTRRPAPAAIENVTVTIRPEGDRAAGQTPQTAQPAGATVINTSKLSDSRWDGGAVNLAAGSLAVDVSVGRPGYPRATAPVPWSVNGPEVWHQSPVLSTAHLAPIVNGAAAFITLLALAVLVASRLERRHRNRSRADRVAISAGGDPVADVADRLDQVAAEFATEPAYVHVDDVAARVE
jgi:copper transport protein